MKAVHWLGLLMLTVAVAVVGCGGASDKQKSADEQRAGGTDKQVDEAQVKANLAKLDPEDRKLAEAQKLCPVSGDPLGEMGTPVKITIEGQPVLLCCRSCQKDARADPAKTLARVKELQAKAATH